MSSALPTIESQIETVLELIGLIYDAIPDASRWRVFMEAFVRATGGRRGSLMLHYADGVAFPCLIGWPDESIRIYFEQYAADDLWRIRGIAAPEGFIGTNFDLASQEEMESTRTFQEFYRPEDSEFGLGGNILKGPSGQATIVCSRGQAEGPFGEKELAILRPLMPHLKRAALFHAEWAAERAELATFTRHLDRYPHPLLLADTSARVLYANAAAREIVSFKDGIAIDGSQLRLGAPRQDSNFKRAITEATKSPTGAVQHLNIVRPSGKSPYRLLLMPAAESGALPLGVSQPAAAILIIDTESKPEPEVGILRELFSLTPAEARVTGGLMLGRNVDDVASEIGSSVETVRTHVRRILSKTGTTRQGELISLILRISPFRKSFDKGASYGIK